MPVQRNAHTAVANGNSVFVFGGQDEDNNKLGDLWEFNLTTKQWAKISSFSGQEFARSGHTAVSFNSKMYVFGGIFEVTKELNDLLVYDFKTQKMSILDKNGDQESPNYQTRFDDSVLKNEIGGGSSPL